MLHEFVNGCTVPVALACFRVIPPHTQPIKSKYCVFHFDCEGWIKFFDACICLCSAECWRPHRRWPTYELIGQEQWWRAQLPGVLAADWASCKHAWGVQPIECPQILCYSSMCVVWLVSLPYSLKKRREISQMENTLKFVSAAQSCVFISGLLFFSPCSLTSCCQTGLHSVTEYYRIISALLVPVQAAYCHTHTLTWQSQLLMLTGLQGCCRMGRHCLQAGSVYIVIMYSWLV